MVILCLVIDGNTKWCSDGIHAAVALTDRVLFLVKAHKARFAFIHQLTGYFGQAISFEQGAE
jgi:hypothetical protein